MVFEQFSELLVDGFAQIGLSVVLGLFVGLEREMSEKSAGVRTFTLVCISGSSLAVLGDTVLIGAGIVIVLLFSALMGIKGITTDKDIGLSLTTSAALLVTYIAGAFSGIEQTYVAVFLAVLAAALLTSKEELHRFAGGMTKQELRSSVQFAVIAFIVYPILPSEPFGPWNAIDAQLVWVLVVAISGIGFVNYVLVKKYSGKGFVATGFFGGLVNSTAVMGTIADRVTNEGAPTHLAVGAVLLANASMAVRNTLIAIFFLDDGGLMVVVPLVSIAVAGVGLSYLYTDWSAQIEFNDFDSPFSLKSVLLFGTVFVVALVVSTYLNQTLGSSGFYISMFVTGLISSGSATTTAVTLVATGQISSATSAFGILIGTASSILVKVALTLTASRVLTKKMAFWSFLLLMTGAVSALIMSVVM